MAITNKFFNERNDAIKFVDDYGSMIFKAKRKAAEEDLNLNQNQQMQNIKAKNLHLNCMKNILKEIENDLKKYKWTNV